MSQLSRSNNLINELFPLQSPLTNLLVTYRYTVVVRRSQRHHHHNQRNSTKSFNKITTMSMNSIEMSANNDAVDDDDNEDDFLPPGFVPGAAPRIVVDLHSPSPHHPRTRRTSVSTDASRNEYLHRSISALKHDHDHDHEEFVDLLGLESIPKENIPSSVNMDSFWLLPTSDTDAVPHETVFSVS